MFLRTEGRTGGPLDPYTAFNESVELLFGYIVSKHPMYDLMHKFSYHSTPKAPVTIKNEEGSQGNIDDSKNMMQPCFADITADI